MKKHAVALLALIVCTTAPSFAAGKEPSVNIGVVSFKTVLEKSKTGVQEQARFDATRKQMEQVLEQKEKELNELAPKFSDEYLDSLTPEAEAELKEKFKNLSQDLTQKQNESYQTLHQLQMKVMQRLFEMVSEASKALAKERGLDLIINDESCFYRADALDLSADIIKKLDEMQVNTSNDKKTGSNNG